MIPIRANLSAHPASRAGPVLPSPPAILGRVLGLRQFEDVAEARISARVIFRGRSIMRADHTRISSGGAKRGNKKPRMAPGLEVTRERKLDQYFATRGAPQLKR